MREPFSLGKEVVSLGAGGKRGLRASEEARFEGRAWRP
ncbi:hypothetical protein WCP94_004003 [Bilophila wadsworthia]